jgi:hypothetical protein
MATTDTQLKKMAIKLGTRLDDVVYLKDYLEKPKVGNFIFNLDFDNRMGTHWCAGICLRDKIFWYDPYGKCPQQNYIEKMTGKKVIYNNVKMQELSESNCGFYCLIFLKEAENVKTEQEFNNALEECKFYEILAPKKKNLQSIDSLKK